MIPELFDPRVAPYRLEGTNGHAVVLLHGFTGVPTHFRPIAERLNRSGFTVNVPLLEGHGTTIDHLLETSYEEWIRGAELATRAVADHRTVHLAGLSMGGLLSIIVAARTAATTITTINSPIVVHDLQLYLSPFAHRLVPTVTWDDPTSPAPEDVAEYDLTYAGFHTPSAAQLVRIMAEAYRCAHRLRRPSLVIQSKADETVRPISGRLLKRALGPPAELFWLERARHNALLDPERERLETAVVGHITRNI